MRRAGGVWARIGPGYKLRRENFSRNSASVLPPLDRGSPAQPAAALLCGKPAGPIVRRGPGAPAALPGGSAWLSGKPQKARKASGTLERGVAGETQEARGPQEGKWTLGVEGRARSRRGAPRKPGHARTLPRG